MSGGSEKNVSGDKNYYEMGEVKLYPISDGEFMLDGGSMFGTIPKPFWERKKPADEKNRIRLALTSLLIETASDLILIEAGLGEKHSPKELDFYGRPKEGTNLIESLEKAEFKPEDIDIVTASHLHLDHAGWFTRYGNGREVIPTFPNARYVVQKKEWDAAVKPDIRSADSYFNEDFLPIKENGLLELVEDRHRLSYGVDMMLTGGHTHGHQIIEISSGGRTCIFLGDLIPTFAHLRLNWIMAWDIFPITLVEAKLKVLEDALENNKLLFFPHEESTPFGEIVKDDKGNMRINPVFVENA